MDSIEKRLSMRPLVVARAADVFVGRGCVVEGLGPEEELGGRMSLPHQFERQVQVRLARACLKLRLWLPPSGFNPAEIAIASTRVDLPLPLSPTMKVMPGPVSIRSRAAMAGIENG